MTAPHRLGTALLTQIDAPIQFVVCGFQWRYLHQLLLHCENLFCENKNGGIVRSHHLSEATSLTLASKCNLDERVTNGRQEAIRSPQPQPVPIRHSGNSPKTGYRARSATLPTTAKSAALAELCT